MASTPAENLFHRAVRLIAEDDRAGAEAALRLALDLRPDMAEAHVNLAWLLEREARPREAESHYREALRLQPQQMQTYLNLGAMLNRQKRFAEAEAIYREALEMVPDMPELLSHLGVLLACAKRETEAEQCYRRALVLAPDYRAARFNLAYVLLRQGRYEEGWHCLEAREPSIRLEEHLSCPCWQGESLRGKSILVGFEAGHGDMIQFARYAALLKQAGARHVSLICHPGLKRLFARLQGADEIIGLDEALPDRAWDYRTLPMSLPFRFGTRLDTIPAALPYLSASPERIRHWADILGARDGKLRAGLVWQGNPKQENDADRSLPSAGVLAPLGQVPQIRWFSLQKGRAAIGGAASGRAATGQAAAEAALAPFPLTDLAPEIEDFDDTAAIVTQLDLVITVDTAVAHLAGALGKRCWVLLPDYKCDWRWLSGIDTSPWYPEVMRLFRQRRMGDWTATIAEVRQALSALAPGKD
jgi:Tfp pilus assembly protein PilF